MIINGERALAYTAQITDIKPIVGADNIELGYINGWSIIVKKGEFKVGDPCIFFEIDSLLPADAPWAAFMAKRNYKVKIMKLNKFGVFSEGLALPYSEFVNIKLPTELNVDVTDLLGVKYIEQEDNVRKEKVDKIEAYVKNNKKKFGKHAKFFITNKFGRAWVSFLIKLNKRKKNEKYFPVGKFEGVSKTDQDRIENRVWVLEDKTPYIVTQKCDGSSGTYILARKPFGRYEFYVCSRNVRMFKPDQECFYGEHNYYWEVAQKYDIERKMRQYLDDNRDIDFVCWQGEICAPAIQKNPHKLKETHFYCFHWTDSKHGRLDIRTAAEIWKNAFGMEVVPIVDCNYILPDDLEELKAAAETTYDPACCEGQSGCKAEGYVYYKTTDPTFSFKNVSREYLLKH